MRFHMEIDSDDDALTGESGVPELVRIVREVADRVAAREQGGKCRDINGITVGRWSRSAATETDEED